MSELTLVRYVQSDRGPSGIYLPGDIAGWEPAVAKKLIAQGFAEPYDAGKGPGKVNPNAIVHLREPWEKEDDPAWLARKASVEGHRSRT